MIRPATALLASALVVVGMQAPVAALAAQADGPSTVVLEFSGRRRTAVRKQVVRALSRRAELIPVASVRAAAELEGVDLDTAAGIARVAERSAVRLFVRGEVRGRGASERTRLHILDESGNEIAFRDVASAGSRGAARLRAAAVAAFLQAVEQLALRDAVVALPEARPEPEPYGEPSPEKARATGRAATWPTLRLLAIGGARNRKALVQLDSGGLRQYESGFFSEIGLVLEVRPFATSEKRGRAPLYFDLSFAGALALSSTVGASGTMVATQAYRIQAQAGYVVPLGPMAVGPVVGFGFDRFHLAENPVMPAVSYPYARLGLVAAVQALPPFLGLRAELGGRFAFAAHNLDLAFGIDTKVRGLDVGVALFGAAPFGLSYEIAARYVRYGLDFRGAAPEPASSGSDRGVEIVGALGWAVD
jgi:hypothetical protein